MPRKRKILYITGGRMDYGLMKETLSLIKKNSTLELHLAICGLHLMPQFGKTIDLIKKDSFKIHSLNTIYQKTDKESMTIFLAQTIIALIEKIKLIKPDFILLLGDRAEMLAGAIVGSYLSIPTAHIAGGDITSTVDDLTRHAISRLSHLHFTQSTQATQRLIKAGEEKWRIYQVGAPGLDDISKKNFLTKENFFKRIGLVKNKKTALIIQHPLTLEDEKAGWQMEQTLSAIIEMDLQAIVIYPNSDAGANQIIALIEKYASQHPQTIKKFKNLDRLLFLSAMKNTDFLIGNSSCGIIESPNFHLPTINLGERQRGREQSANIINVPHNKEKIKQAIRKIFFDEKFKTQLKSIKNPYENGKTSIKITKILSQTKINKKLLDKKFSF